MKRLFLSYTNKDINKEYLIKIREWLNNQNFENYIDILDNSYDLKLFQKKLIETLKKCDALLIIETDNYYQSPWTKIEIDSAVKKNIPIIRLSKQRIDNAIIFKEKLINL